jgi:PhnB protein
MMTDTAKSLPEGMHTLNPHIVCADCAGAMEFYKKAFGATEEMRLPGPNGKLMHAAMRFGDSMLMLMDEMPEWGAKGPKLIGGTPVTIHMVVDDVDAVFARAVDAGAKVVMPVADQFWGDRYGIIEDPYGHSWSMATPSGKQLSPEEMAANMKAMASA